MIILQLQATHKSQSEELESRLHQELSDLSDQHNAVLTDVKMTYSKELEAAEAKIKDLKDELISYMAKGKLLLFLQHTARN